MKIKSIDRIIMSPETNSGSFSTPRISNAIGQFLQADIMEVNRATLRMLSTAASLGRSEPLAAALLGTSNEVISLFAESGRNERVLVKTLGFPLVQLRFNDVATVRTLLTAGAVDAATVQAITKSFPFDVIQATVGRPGL